MIRKPYKQYCCEFKLEAIRLAEVGDKTASQVARELGIRVQPALEVEAATGG